MPKVVDRSERRGALLSAALTVFAEHGYHRATMQAIADRAGVSKGGLYDYFESKEVLLVELARWLFGQLIEVSLDALEREPAAPIAERVARFTDASIGHVGEWTDVASIMLQMWAELGSREDSALRGVMQELYVETLDRMAAVFDAVVADGEMPPFDTRAAAVAMCAAFDGAMLQTILVPEEVRRAIDAGAFARLCQGLLPRAAGGAE